MEAKVIVQFNSNEELVAFLELIKEKGLNNLTLKVKGQKHIRQGAKEKSPLEYEAPAMQIQKHWTGIGSADSKGLLDRIPNLRDFAYDE
ncbi:MAG: hypothetical protein ACOYPR_17055 [Saprospiraceae bacterium]